MERIAVASIRLEQADDVPGILDAVCDAFEDMLPVIHDQQDPVGGAFTAFVMAAALAANGRDAVLHAPSLPPTAPGHRASDDAVGLTALEAATTLASLGRLLDKRLTEAAARATDPRDRRASLQGAWQARQLASLLTAVAGP